MKTEIAKLNLVKDQVKLLERDLTAVPPRVYTKDWKPIEPRQEKLAQFLEMNDCEKTVAKSSCYRTTRLFLISTTKELDTSTNKINALNEVIDKLTENISVIINEVSDKGVSLK